MTDFHALASSFYLCETLPDGWDKWDEDTYNAFLTDNAWEPFEYSDADDIHEMIDNLALTFAQVDADARKQQGGNT